jgi:hypothetical protein
MTAMRHVKAAALAAACLAACACQERQSQSDEAGNAANAARPQTVPEIPIPVPEPPLGREQLLVDAMQAASAFATGSDDTNAQRELAGKKFEFRVRFGCEEREIPPPDFSWSFDPATGALKVRAAPTLSSEDPPVKAIAGDAFETVEGFWIARPWLVAAACPRPNPASAPLPDRTPDSHILGIAQFFTATGPRTLRRSGRAYEATKKLAEGEKPSGGFDLVLSGRLAPLPNGRVIACTAAEKGARPSCIISVEFGKVWIERADTKEHLADWGTG